MSEEQQVQRYTPNQLVAHNLRLARELRGWSQKEAAERLGPYLRTPWSSASYSLAERSVARADRIRNFSADEIVAFSEVFNLPVTWFFLPPKPDTPGKRPLIAPLGKGAGRTVSPEQLIELVLGDPETQALLVLRVQQSLDDFPGQDGPYLRLLDSLSSILMKRSINQVVSELATKAEQLRETAVMLEAAGNTTRNLLESTITQAVADFYQAHQELAGTEDGGDEGTR